MCGDAVGLERSTAASWARERDVRSPIVNQFWAGAGRRGRLLVFLRRRVLRKRGRRRRLGICGVIILWGGRLRVFIGARLLCAEKVQLAQGCAKRNKRRYKQMAVLNMG